MSGITLRDYQSECVAAVEDGVRRGVRRQLAVLPTGGGKTIIFSEIVRRRSAGSTLILAHRDELLQQAREKLISVAPELSMSTGLVKARSNDVGAPVVIASIQTLARESRLRQLPKDFGTVIIDEAHHSAADSYQRVLEWVDAELVLGVTATPERHDGKSLESHFDELIFARSIEWMVERTIPLNKEQTIVLWPDAEERYDVLLLTVESKRKSFRFLARGLDLGYAQGAAEETIRRHGNRLLADSKAAWREDAPSPGQIRFLHRLKLQVPRTKGEAADLITEATLAKHLVELEAALVRIDRDREVEAREQAEAVVA